MDFRELDFFLRMPRSYLRFSILILFFLCWVFSGPIDSKSTKKKAASVPSKKAQTWRDIEYNLVAGPYKEPTDLQFRPDEPETLVVLEKRGRIYSRNLKTQEARLVADFTGSVETRSEEGLLGLAFHPKFSENKLFYVNAVSKESGKDQTLILEFRWEEGKTLSWSDRKRILLRVDQPYSNHNAGQLSFGPDEKLYIGFGDGGAGGDPYRHGQNTSTFLSTLIRIEPNMEADAPPYKIPSDNPFREKVGFLPEIWAYGFRNPWRFSFDSKTGNLFLADVGQDTWEEVDLVSKGGNYGWSVMEASHCFRPEKDCEKKGLRDPVLEYGRDLGRSVTGGYVYRGKNYPILEGWYIFGDFVSGNILGARLEPGKITSPRLLFKTSFQISTFGSDRAGELYFADFSSGNIFRFGKKIEIN